MGHWEASGARRVVVVDKWETKRETFLSSFDSVQPASSPRMYPRIGTIRTNM